MTPEPVVMQSTRLLPNWMRHGCALAFVGPPVPVWGCFGYWHVPQRRPTRPLAFSTAGGEAWTFHKSVELSIGKGGLPANR